jgi:hypothetical protein
LTPANSAIWFPSTTLLTDLSLIRALMLIPLAAMTEVLRDILDREDESAARDAFLKENTVQALNLSSKTEGASGFIRVSEFESDILQLQNPGDIAHEGNSITVLYNYPLSTCGPSTLESCFKSWEFPIKSPGGGSLTVSDVVRGICVKYREIYEEEEVSRIVSVSGTSLFTQLFAIVHYSYSISGNEETDPSTVDLSSVTY